MAIPSSWHEEDGFKYHLFPAKSKKPDCLIIYLHGVDNVAEIPDNYMRTLQNKIPGADVIALQAPIKIRPSHFYKDPIGYSWFPLIMSLKSEIKTWFTHAFKRLTIAEKVEAFTKSQLAKRELTEDKLAYYGYSQGGIVALQAGLSGDKPVAAIVSLSGSVMPLTTVKNKSKVFLQMGEQDHLFNIPLPQLPEKGILKRTFIQTAERISLNHARSVQRLKSQNVPLTEKMYPKQGHIPGDDTMWKDGIDFIAKAFANTP